MTQPTLEQQVESLKSQLQDAHLVVGEQTVAIRRLQMILEQLQGQVAQQNGDLSEVPSDREPIPIPHQQET